MLVNNSSLMLRVGFGSDGSVQREGFAFDDPAIGMPITYDYGMDSVMGICDTSFMLDAGAGYAWYRIDDLQTGQKWYNQTVEIAQTGNYRITVADSMGMCGTDDVYLEILNFVQPDLQDMMACVGDSAMWDGQPDTLTSTYMWSTGDTTQTSWLFNEGSIILTKTDTVTGCMSMDTAMLTYNTPVDLTDMNVCMGDTGMFDASIMNGTYQWSTGDSTAMIWSTTAGT
jgi:hypothetical protein